jgi:hypothetical protein
MPLEIKLALFGALVALTLLAGLVWKARTGRANLVKSGEIVDLGKLESASMGARPLLFSFQPKFARNVAKPPDFSAKLRENTQTFCTSKST